MLREATVIGLIDRWIGGGLVPAASRETMVADVQQTRWVLNPVVIVISIACSLLALAVLAQVAMNWQDIPKFVRLALLCLGLVVLYGMAVWRLVSVGLSDHGLHVFAFLGVMFYGGAVLLVSQMFHIGGSVSGWLLVWLLGAVLTTFVLSSRLVLNLTLVLVGIWAAVTILPDGHLRPFQEYVWEYLPLLALLLIPVLRYCSCIAVVLWQILLLGWLDILILDQHDGAFNSVVLGVGMIGLLHLAVWQGLHEVPSRWQWPVRVSEILHYGVVLAAACVMVWTMQYESSLDRMRLEGPLLFPVLAAGALLGWMVAQFYRNRLRPLTLVSGLLLLALSGCFLFYPLVDSPRALFFYHTTVIVLLLGVLIAMILNGSREGRRGPMILGSLLLAITCVIVYIEWGFTNSAILFFLTGTALLLGAKLVRRLVS